jgi:hypothetical protein
MDDSRRSTGGPVIDQPPPVSDPVKPDPTPPGRFVAIVAIVVAVALALAILLTTGLLGS